ncbi:hypothetical protein M8994_08050 [Brucella sp. 21LCYQ03]|nr:hypothetical protein [Brucella sp. 21LCYQ03]
MMFNYQIFSNLSPTIFVLTATAVISGCTTTQPLQLCSNQQIERLSKQIAPTKASLSKNQTQLTSIRIELAKEQCVAGLFTRATKSQKCDRLKSQEDKLNSENKILEERLHETDAAITGRAHPGQHVKSCSASWLPVRVTKKAAPKRPPVKAQVKKVEKPSKPVATAGLPIEDYVVPAYSSAQPMQAEPIGYTSPSRPISHAPSHVAPVAPTPPVERAYSENANVRVIGSSFFHDQSKPVGPQAPDREAAQ